MNVFKSPWFWFGLLLVVVLVVVLWHVFKGKPKKPGIGVSQSAPPAAPAPSGAAGIFSGLGSIAQAGASIFSTYEKSQQSSDE